MDQKGPGVVANCNVNFAVTLQIIIWVETHQLDGIWLLVMDDNTERRSIRDQRLNNKFSNQEEVLFQPNKVCLTQKLCSLYSNIRVASAYNYKL